MALPITGPDLLDPALFLPLRILIAETEISLRLPWKVRSTANRRLPGFCESVETAGNSPPFMANNLLQIPGQSGCQAALPLPFRASSASRPVSSAMWSKLAR